MKATKDRVNSYKNLNKPRLDENQAIAAFPNLKGVEEQASKFFSTFVKSRGELLVVSVF